MAMKLADTNYMTAATDITAQTLEMLKDLKVYKYTDDSSYANLTRFCIAGQDLEKKVPQACMTDGVGMKYTDEVMLIPIIIGAINALAAKGGSGSQDTAELTAAIEALTTRVAALETAANPTEPEVQSVAAKTTTAKKTTATKTAAK